MKKEYHFAAVQFDETAQKVICPVCSCDLDDGESMVRVPIGNHLSWICASCAVKKAILDGMPNVRFNATHMSCYGDRSCASFDTVDVGIISEVCRA